ncbi:DEAD/DEAH box helicase [Nakamurella silvestris]|nr:DEAD/DEAH box helicase [Nakamurella silvestris]
MPGRRRKPAARRSSGTRTARRPAADLPVAGPGERIWLLDVPYGTTAVGARWVPQWKAFAHVAVTLPESLAEFASKPFSYQRWIEDDVNGRPGPPAHGIAPKQPRRQQYEGADAIIAAAESGARQFLLADAPGTGKTITLIMAATEIALSRAGGRTEPPRILVAVDRPVGITVPHWRTSIAAVDTGDPRTPRWLVISPDQLTKLLAGNGRPRFSFDVIILDEAQLYRHLDTKRVTAMRRVARYADAHEGAPFVIAATATPAHNPAELTYLGPVLAQVHGQRAGDWSDVGARMQEVGLPLEQQYRKWTWAPGTTGADQQAAAQTVRRWLTDHNPALMLHRPAEWGEAPLEPMPVELDAAEHQQYQSEWAIFRREMDLARVGRSTAKGRAAIMRFRQKAGMIRVPYTVDWAANQVKAGRQVVISVEFVSTAADPIAEALADKGIEVARIYGSGRYDVEAERLRFQRGQAQVCVFTVTSSISLHAGEMLADGTSATDTPRVGVLHQPGYSGIATRQRLGRIHRDGQVGEWWLAFAEGTVEEQITGTLLDRLRATSDLVGGDTTALQSIAEMLGAQWLPEQVLGETGEPG